MSNRFARPEWAFFLLGVRLTAGKGQPIFPRDSARNAGPSAVLRRRMPLVVYQAGVFLRCAYRHFESAPARPFPDPESSPEFERPVDGGPRVWQSVGRRHSSYVTTYVERDLRQICSVRELAPFQRFMRMCTARVGQLLNLSSLAAECGVTHNTARSWLSGLEANSLAFLLQPHLRNFGKRLMKTSKPWQAFSGSMAGGYRCTAGGSLIDAGRCALSLGEASMRRGSSRSDHGFQGGWT